MHDSSNIYVLRYQHNSYSLTIREKLISHSVLSEDNTTVYFQLPRVLLLISTNLQHPANLAEILMVVSVDGEAFASTFVGLKVRGTAKNISPVTFRRSVKRHLVLNERFALLLQLPAQARPPNMV